MVGPMCFALFLGLDTDAWTAIGSIGTVLALVGSAIGFLMKRLRGSNEGHGAGPTSEGRDSDQSPPGSDGPAPSAGNEPGKPEPEDHDSDSFYLPPLSWEPVTERVSLSLMETGGALVELLVAADMQNHEFDEPNNEEDMALVRDFLRQTTDWSEALGELSPDARVEAGWKLSGELDSLRAAGWLVYAGSYEQGVAGNVHRVALSAVSIRVVREPVPSAA